MPSGAHKRKRPDNRGAPKLHPVRSSGSELGRLDLQDLLELAIGTARGFIVIASGIPRTRSKCEYLRRHLRHRSEWIDTAPPVQCSILEAKAEPISDKRLPSDNKSLFDAVPLLTPL